MKHLRTNMKLYGRMTRAHVAWQRVRLEGGSRQESAAAFIKYQTALTTWRRYAKGEGA